MNSSTQSPANQARKIYLMETTLRDGEQAPYVNFFAPERLLIAKALADTLTEDDTLDVGFPASSKAEFDSIASISREVGHLHLLGLARMVERDIDAVRESLGDHPRRRIALIVPTSDSHRQFKLGITQEELVTRAVTSLRYARRFFDYVEVGFEDATRSRREFIFELATRLIAEGATCVCLPDTIGCATPEEYGDLFAAMRSQVPNIGNLEYLEAHCHNDLGLALANCLAALRNGANMAGTAFNGIGERAGNTSTEELLMVMRTKPEAYPNVNTDRYAYHKIAECSALVERCSGLKVQAHKAIVGANCYRHESGIHQDGLLKAPALYQAFGPDVIGATVEQIVIGKHSGVNGMRQCLQRLGIAADATQAAEVLRAVKERLATKRSVDDDEILALAHASGLQAAAVPDMAA
ncbi:LeuA family protein [Roseateles flavus]|uniref:2-isopropylmalate synthase n=1 Tax=Roseateles flavus TaxID=3149041 RepID=A0ABV0GJG5_9BURK